MNNKYEMTLMRIFTQSFHKFSRAYLFLSCVPANSSNLRLVDHWKYNLNPNNDNDLYYCKHYVFVSYTKYIYFLLKQVILPYDSALAL